MSEDDSHTSNPENDTPNGFPEGKEIGEEPTVPATGLPRYWNGPDDPTIPLPAHGTAVPSSSPSRTVLAVGQELGPYRILRLLGKGGMGEVYEALHIENGRRLALKVLSHSLSDAHAHKRFMREGRLAASISHPHCVYVYGTEKFGTTYAIAMELAPAGNLYDLVAGKGPLACREAVDYTLQLISGLEAAAEAGVLHRDIKPSNCFLDPSGIVKIGDFGLSVSSYSDLESRITIPGSVMGTPHFASPEQLRGGDLDLCSDIYSLGATLYFLLTGQTPFTAPTLPALLAQVLQDPAPSPAEARKDIPQGLCEAVLTCMAKRPDQRYQTYDEFRQALMPFSSEGPVPAGRSFRFLAAYLDLLLIGIPCAAIAAAFRNTYYNDAIANVAAFVNVEQLDFLVLGVEFALTLPVLLYFLVMEWRYQATLFKRLFGIRVISVDGSPPTFWQVLVRASIFWFLNSMDFFAIRGFQLSGFLPPDPETWTLWHRIPIMLLSWLCLVPIISIRKRNGYATLYDLLTDTRVVAQPPQKSTAQNAQAKREPTARPVDGQRVGFYEIPAGIDFGTPGQVCLGYDPVLRRNVWLRRAAADEPPVNSEARDLARRGRLRWLTGTRTPEGSWDAYEYVDGCRLLDRESPAKWEEVRIWLLDLAEELAAVQESSAFQPELNLDRIWIGHDGHARILDFPLNIETDSGNKPESEALTVAGVQTFLWQCAQMALGNASAPLVNQEVARNRMLPLHAYEMLSCLRDRSFKTSDGLIRQLHSTQHKPTTIPRWRKFIAASLTSLMPFTLGGIMVANVQYVENKLYAIHPDIIVLGECLGRLSELNGDESSSNEADADEVKALQIYISVNFGDTIQETSLRENALVKAYYPHFLSIADACLDYYPNPTQEDAEWANSMLEEQLQQYRKRDYVLAPQYAVFWGNFGAVYLIIAICSSVIFTVTRGGILPRAFGIAIIAKSGRRASRSRCFLRSLITWSPVLLAFVNLLTLRWLAAPYNICVPFAILGAGALWLTFGQRSVQDAAAGTFLVAE